MYIKTKYQIGQEIYFRPFNKHKLKIKKASIISITIKINKHELIRNYEVYDGNEYWTVHEEDINPKSPLIEALDVIENLK